MAHVLHTNENRCELGALSLGMGPRTSLRHTGPQADHDCLAEAWAFCMFSVSLKHRELGGRGGDEEEEEEDA